MPSGLKPVVIIDSGIIWGTGKPRDNQHAYRHIRRAVESEDQTLYLPATSTGGTRRQPRGLTRG
jgi:hypothetical protein